MSIQNVFEQSLNRRMHKLSGFFNELSYKLGCGTIHVWNGEKMVCYGFHGTPGKWHVIEDNLTCHAV